jgi:hypothetical protein
MTVQMIKVSRSFTITHRDLQYDIKYKINIYEKISYFLTFTTSLSPTIEQRISLKHSKKKSILFINL